MKSGVEFSIAASCEHSERSEFLSILGLGFGDEGGSASSHTSCLVLSAQP